MNYVVNRFERGGKLDHGNFGENPFWLGDGDGASDDEASVFDGPGGEYSQ